MHPVSCHLAAVTLFSVAVFPGSLQNSAHFGMLATGEDSIHFSCLSIHA